MNPQKYRNHYKTHPEWKNRLLFFVVGGFYRAYESDAILLSYLFGFQVQVQGGMRMTGFPANAGEKYFDLLKQGDYSYVLLQLHETGPVVLQYHIGQRPLEVTVSIDIYTSLLDEMKAIIQKYEGTMRLVKHVDLPFLDSPADPLPPPPDLSLCNDIAGNNGVDNKRKSPIDIDAIQPPIL